MGTPLNDQLLVLLYRDELLRGIYLVPRTILDLDRLDHLLHTLDADMHVVIEDAYAVETVDDLVHAVTAIATSDPMWAE